MITTRAACVLLDNVRGEFGIKSCRLSNEQNDVSWTSWGSGASLRISFMPFVTTLYPSSPATSRFDACADSPRHKACMHGRKTVAAQGTATKVAFKVFGLGGTALSTAKV